MARTRKKAKGRGGTPPFFRLTHELLDSPLYISLPYTSKALLVDIVRQYNGHNNGDLAVTLSLMERRGWNSNGTMRRALEALENSGLLIRTRQGGKHRCSLFALAWLPIDECKGKLEIEPTITPPLKLSLQRY